jgi:O-antigen/teichoic acid export membrane protein
MSQQAKKAINVLLVYYFISQGIRLGVNLIVSRLVAPDVFGIMAVVITILIGLAMFSDVGLEAYVMRSKDYKDKKSFGYSLVHTSYTGANTKRYCNCWRNFVVAVAIRANYRRIWDS